MASFYPDVILGPGGAMAYDAGVASLASEDGTAGLLYVSAANTWTRLALAADKGIYATAAGAMATFDLSSFSRTTLASASAAAWRTALAVVPGTDLQAYSAILTSLASSGAAPSPWHVRGYWNGAEAWVIGQVGWAKYDVINADPDTGNGTTAATNWSFQAVADAGTTDGGASSLGRGRSLDAGTLSASRAFLHGGTGVAPFRRDAGFRVTHSFSIAHVGTHRCYCVVSDTDFTTIVAADDTSGAAIFGLRWIPADGANLQVVRNAGAGASTVTDSGVAYTAGVRYTVTIGTVDTSTMLIEIITHSAWTAGTVTRITHTTTLPGTTTSLKWGVGIRTSAANATAQSCIHYQSSMQAS